MASPPSSAGLVAHWRLDEIAGGVVSDASGSGNDGTVLGGATAAAGFPRAQFPNRGGVIMDGVDDQIVAGAKRLPATDAAKTISLWVRYPTSTAGVDAFLSLSNRAVSCGVHIGRRSGLLTAWNWGGELVVSTPERPAGWHHVLYRFDGRRHSLSIDGDPPVSSSTAAQSCPVTDAVIGNYQGGGNHFLGTIDDVRVYDRVLDDSQARRLSDGLE